MSNFQLVLVYFNEKGSNYINGSTKHRESKEYSKHGFNPLCVLRGKIAAHPYLCVGALTVYPKKTQRTGSCKETYMLKQLPDSSEEGKTASHLLFFKDIQTQKQISSKFQLCQMLQILPRGLSACIQIRHATSSIKRKKSEPQH